MKQAKEKQALGNNARMRSIADDLLAYFENGETLGKDPHTLLEESFDEARSLISQALDYTEGKSVFNCVLVGAWKSHQKAMLTQAMIAEGFNPLTDWFHDRGNINNLSWSPGSNIGHLKDVATRNLLEDQLAVCEVEGPGLRNAQGGNLYHTLALLSPNEFADTLGRLFSYAERLGKNEQLVAPRIAWINERDDQGNTPLHVLWGTDVLREVFDDEMPFPSAMEALNQDCADATMTAYELGADLMATNHKGERVSALMAQRKPEGLDERGQEILEIARSLEHGRQMDNDTPAAQVRNKPGNRL